MTVTQTVTQIDEPRLYDVWLMWVEFPDHPGIGKPRPVIIVNLEENVLSGIVAKVTGNTTWSEPGDVPLLDWEAEGLANMTTGRR